MKTPKIFLRIAAILMLVHTLLHTIGHSGWKQATDPAQKAVVKQMTGPKFPFMGVQRSMGEFFDGYGYGCSVAMLLFVLALWLVSGELQSSPRLAKKLLPAIALCLLLWGVDEIVYFFPFAASVTLLAFAYAVIAWFTYKSASVL